MNLEDHIGDIIRKSRLMTNVSEEAAAKAAGLTVEELVALEDSGKITKRPNLKALAPLIDLHPDKLERIANGWLPKPPDLGVWRELRQISTNGNGITVHCYLVWDEVTREAALFDTGFDPKPVFDLIERNQVRLKHLFLTHTHGDHIAGMEAVQRKFPEARLHTNAKSAPPQHRNR